MRVSSEEQKKSGYSLASQRRLLKEKMRNDNVVPISPPIVDVESGRNFEREGLKKMLKLAKSGSIDFVYIHDLDRLGRHVAETPYLMYKLKEETGVVVRTMSDEYNFEDPFDYVLATIKSFPGDVESRKLGERTQRGKIEKFRQGKWVGPTPFGYRKNASSELEKLPELVPIVADIFQTYGLLGSIKKVTHTINERYSGTIGFSANQIRRILTNSVYIGNPKYGKIEIRTPALAMVPPELYHKVQRLINEKAGKSKIKKYRKPRSILDDFAAKYGTDYVMRVLDILKPDCPKCQTRMVGYGSKSLQRLRVPNFRCPSCKYQRTIPSASELERFQGDLLSCPNCRSVENFNVRRRLDGSDERTCRRCGFSFRLDVQHPLKLVAKGKGKRTRESVKYASGRDNVEPENCSKYNFIGPFNYATKYSPKSFKEAKRVWRKQKVMERKGTQRVTKQEGSTACVG